MLVRLYLSFFSISKLVLLAKRHHYNYEAITTKYTSEEQQVLNAVAELYR